MTGGWILIPNWSKFQHYRDRGPLWIKLYTNLRSRHEWRELSYPQRGLLVSLWIEYAASDGQLPVAQLPQRLSFRVDHRSLDALVQAEFIQISASRPLALTRALEEKRREDPQTPTRKRKIKTAGDRIETLIRNGVITDPIALEAELRGEGLNSDLADNLRELLRPL